MQPTDEQIEKLMDWFVNFSEIYKKWTPKRRLFLQENNRWIQPEIIKDLSDDELSEKFLVYYNNNTRQVLNKINRNKIVQDKTRFREVLAFLLDESVDIKKGLMKF